MANKKFLDHSGVEALWQRIRDRYDKKLDSVTNRDDTIVVSSGREIGVRISPLEGNILEQRQGLYVTVPAMHTLTFGSDQQYVYDGSADVTVPVYDGTYD